MKQKLQTTTKDTLSIVSFQLERKILVNTLTDFARYCDIWNPISNSDQVYYFVQDGECCVIGTDHHKLALKRFPTKAKGCHAFCLPCMKAKILLEIIKDFSESRIDIAYNTTCTQFVFFDEDSQTKMTIELQRNDKLDYSIFAKVLEVRTISHELTISTQQFKSYLKRALDNLPYTEILYLVFRNKRVIFHMSDKSFHKTITEWYDIDNEDADFVLKLNRKNLSIILDDIFSEKVRLMVVNDNWVYMLNDDESLNGSSLRFIMRCLIQKEDEIILEELSSERLF